MFSGEFAAAAGPARRRAACKCERGSLVAAQPAPAAHMAAAAPAPAGSMQGCAASCTPTLVKGGL